MKVGDNKRNNLSRDTNIKDGTIPNGATLYHELSCEGDMVTSVQLYWPDAVSAATITLQGTNFALNEAPATDTSKKWFDLPVTITGPTATAEGSDIVDLSGLGELRLRLRIVTTAVTKLYVRTNGKH